MLVGFMPGKGTTDAGDVPDKKRPLHCAFDRIPRSGYVGIEEWLVKAVVIYKKVRSLR